MRVSIFADLCFVSFAAGTMRRAVQALKSTYETPVFPILDRVRSGLGVQVDAELSHIKGRMMQDIIDQYLKTPSPSKDVSNEAAPVIRGAGCPFGGGGSSLSPSHSFDRISPPKSTTNSLFGVYSWEGLSVEACKSASSEVKRLAASLGLVNHARGACGAGGPLAFLDHAWGQVSPRALHAALKDLNAMCLLGNPAWDHLFGHLMPRVAGHIRRLLGIEGAISANEEPGEAVSVHFGHNSHELVTRLLSQALFEREDTTVPLSILTSDTEFYSITRQLNRLVEAGAVNVHAVPADRPRTFAERCIAEATSAAAAGRPYDIVYVSQVSFLRQATLLDNVPAFVEALLEAVGGVGNTQSSTKRSNISGADRPLIIIDGYHAFGAFPVELGAAAQHCCYVAGLLKHTGCGPNCAFVTVPRAMELRPVFTGWLADPSVLGPGSAGIAMGSPVHYDKDLALQGGTPAFFLPLLVFDHVMRMWQEAKPAVDVETIHAHVLVLQEALIQGLPDRGIVGLTQETLVPVANAPCRSHTLVFAQPGAAEAKAVVEGLGRCGVLVDCRREMVRVGLGPNHSMADVQELLECLKGLTLG